MNELSFDGWFLSNITLTILVTFQAVDILRMDYEPSDLDILYAEGVTSSNGLACVDFSFPQSASEDVIDSAEPDSLTRLVPVHP